MPLCRYNAAVSLQCYPRPPSGAAAATAAAAARGRVASSLRFDRTGSVSVFETTIRELGGLLAAFDLSGDAVFLDKAEDLGRRLLRAFDTPSGLPFSSVSLTGGGRGSNAGWTGNNAVLAELGTLQIDFRYKKGMHGLVPWARVLLLLTCFCLDVIWSPPPPPPLY